MTVRASPVTPTSSPLLAPPPAANIVSHPSEYIPITPLPSDGVLVTQHGHVRAAAGKWKVLVTMDVPRAPLGLRQEILEVKRVVVTAPASATVRLSWRRRLSQLELSLPLPSSPASKRQILPGRVRLPRGLLDPLGVLIHDIFGLATTAEIENIKAAIRSVGNNQAALVHNINTLTTIVNRTRIFAQENRDFLRRLARQVRNTHATLFNLTRDFNSLSMQMAMEQVIEDLELQVSNVARFQSLYAHRRQDLHNLRLTEELLPITSLRSILASANSYNSVPLSDINWYYTHESVRPMWATSDFLVYEVDLHLVRPSEFLLYRVRTWPVPVSSAVSVKISLSGDFGYDTNSGHLFRATHCQGSNPQVCSSGPLFKANSPPCVRGILKGDQKLMKHCPVVFIPGNKSALYFLSGNEYVLTTWGESFEARCTGKNAQISVIPKGTFHFFLPTSCSLSGPTWTISALSLHLLSVHLSPIHLPRPHALNFSNLIHSTRLAMPSVSLVQAAGSLAAIPLDALQHPYLEPLKLDVGPSHYVRDIALALCLAIATGLIIFVLWQYRHACRLPTRAGISRPTRRRSSRPPSATIGLAALPAELQTFYTPHNRASAPECSPQPTTSNHTEMVAQTLPQGTFSEGMPDAVFQQILRAVAGPAKPLRRTSRGGCHERVRSQPLYEDLDSHELHLGTVSSPT